MSRPPSPAQRANQLTFVLKGHLKNARVAYIRAAALLARVREEKLWQALGHRSIEDYAAKRLPLNKTALYQYLRVYDWLKRSHRAWLAQRPKGFIPELSDATALMWIENRLRDPRLGEDLRRDLEKMRRKGLAGTLTEREFREIRARAGRSVAPLRSALARLRSLRRLAERIAKFPAAARDGIDQAIRAVEGALAAAAPVARLSGIRATTLARLGSGRSVAAA